MSLSRSPSPSPGGGWSSPGLNIQGSGRSSPSRSHAADSNGAAPGAWESTRTRNAGTSKYPSFSTQNQGFFTRHMRQLSSSLPRFHNNSRHADKEKHSRSFSDGANASLGGRFRLIFARMGRKLKFRVLLASLLLICAFVFYHTREHPIPSHPTCGRFCWGRRRKANHWSNSPSVLLAENSMAGRWRENRHHSGGKRRRWRHGMERCKGVGNRKGQHTEQKAIRRTLGLRSGNCRHEHEEALCARMARELGEGRFHQTCPPQIP